LLAQPRPFGQTNFEGTEGTIAGIYELIDDVKMDAARRGARNTNLRLTIGKMETRAKGQAAARSEKCTSAQGSRTKNAQPSIRKQDEVILPGRRLPVKTCPSAILTKNLKSCSHA